MSVTDHIDVPAAAAVPGPLGAPDAGDAAPWPFGSVPEQGSLRARALNASFSRVSGPMMSAGASGNQTSAAALIRSMRPGVNRALCALSPVPADTRVTEVRSTQATLPSASFGTTGSVRGEWVTGPWVKTVARAEQRIIYYLHGSGYVVCTPRTHRGLVARLSRRSGLPAFSLDYRLAPRHRFPAAGDDAIRGYHWLLEQGFRAENIIVAGDSAGGHLALDILADNQRTGVPHPSAMALFSPLYDPSFSIAVSYQQHGARDPHIEAVAAQKILRLYTADTHPDHPRMRIRLAADSALPDTLIQVGGLEVMADDARAIHTELLAAGASSELQLWPHQGHVFQMFPRLTPESRSAVSQAGRFIGARR